MKNIELLSLEGDENGNLPAQHTKNQIHHEKCTQNNHRYEVAPLPCAAGRILHLWKSNFIE